MSYVSADALSQLLHLAYETTEHAEGWPVFLQQLAATLQAHGASIVRSSLTDGGASAVWHGWDPVEISAFEQYYASINPWLPKTPVASQDPEENGAIASDSVLPLSQLKRTEFYADWGRRNDVVFSYAANLRLDDTTFLYLSASRGERSGPFPAEVGRILELVTPHVRRALSLHNRISQISALQRALDVVSLAVFSLDLEGRVVDMSGRARALVDRRDGLMMDSRGHLLGQGASGSRAIRHAIGSLQAHPTPRVRLIRLYRGDRREHVAVLTKVATAVPLSHVGPTRRFTLTVIEPELTNQQALAEVGKLFGLTVAEQALLTHLVGGGSLETARVRFGTTKNTVKTQLAAIFDKTGTRRQADLVRIFSHYARISDLL